MSKSLSQPAANNPWEPSAHGPEDCLAGGGEMGEMMRRTDWQATPLGPVASWPRSLRTMVGVVINNRFPMLVWWGPDFLQLYNDAYRPILREKHPAALAAPAPEVWAEVWGLVGPMAQSIREGGPSTWMEDLQLFISNGAMAEEAFFTFSFSPIPGDDVRIGGVLVTVRETTAHVQGERQMRVLHEISAHVARTRSEREAYRLGLEVLANDELDFPFALLYTLDDTLGGGGEYAQLMGEAGWRDYQGPARPARVQLFGESSAESWPIADVMRSGTQLLLEDLATRFGELPESKWHGRVERAVILPLVHAGQRSPRSFLVLGVSPHRVLDERYQRFLFATADQLLALVASALAWEAATLHSQALTELDRAKMAFFSNVSHELRTPLTLMLGPLEDALAAPPAEAVLAGEPLQMVRRNALRLLKLVNSLLDFARLEAGRMRATFQPCDLAALTADLASAFRSSIERVGLAFEVDCPPLEELVYVDPDLWEKVVLNLLSNALKFTFAGSISISVRRRGEHVEMAVRDTGTGIPQRELPQLFSRFHRVAGARSRSHEGTGIGLALTRDLVQLHGGTITAQSQHGRGSTFVVSLPLGTAHLPKDCIASGEATGGAGNAAHKSWPAMTATAYVEETRRWGDDEQLGDAAEPSPGAGGPAGRADDESPGLAMNMTPRTAASAPGVPSALTSLVDDPSPARVLVVDDNADLRGYLQALLRPHYAVETAPDGLAALKAIQLRKPTLVLSDVMMPRLDGFGLLRALRSDPQLRGIPVLLLSARAGEEATLEGLAAYADDYLVKPFSTRELLARVRTHVALARQREVFERFFDLSLDMMCIASIDGYFKRVSPAFAALGYAPDELLRRPLIDFVHPDDVAATLAEIEKLSCNVPSLSFENRYRCKDGSYRWLAWNAAPDPSGTLYAVARDVTGIKQDQAALRDAKDAAEMASRELESFSYSVAHDLRAPLRSIDGFSLALLEDYDDKLDAEGRQYLTFVRESAQRMAVLIDDLLALSRVTRSELGNADVDLSAVAQAVVSRLHQTSPGRAVTVEIEEGLTTTGDPRLLAVVLENLLGNAWKFTARRADAHIQVGATTAADGHRAFFVRDDGAGFDMAFAHKLFGVFQRLHAATEFEGTGIGLATVQRVVRRHGGRVWARGEVGEGATFFFTLHERDNAA